MSYRNRKLLDLAHIMPCMAQWPHDCKQHEGVEPAHSDSSMFGRGVGHKSSDWAYAALCHTAHLMLGDMGREEKFQEWLRAYIQTTNYLWVGGWIVIQLKLKI